MDVLIIMNSLLFEGIAKFVQVNICFCPSYFREQQNTQIGPTYLE